MKPANAQLEIYDAKVHKEPRRSLIYGWNKQPGYTFVNDRVVSLYSPRPGLLASRRHRVFFCIAAGLVQMMTRWLGVLMFVGCAGAYAAPATTENAYAPAWGPAIRNAAPAINAPDQHSQTQTLTTLAGPNGLLLFFVRSADW